MKNRIVRTDNLEFQMETLVSKFLNSFGLEIKCAKDDIDYFVLVSSVLIFKELILSQFRYALEKDLDTMYNSDDICKVMEMFAEQTSYGISRKVLQKNVN